LFAHWCLIMTSFSAWYCQDCARRSLEATCLDRIVPFRVLSREELRDWNAELPRRFELEVNGGAVSESSE